MYTLYNSYDSGKAYDYDGILLVISLWIGWLWFNQKVIVLVSFTELNELLKILGLPGVRQRKLRWPMLEVMWLRTRNVLEELQVVPVQQIPGGWWCSVCLNKQKEKKNLPKTHWSWKRTHSSRRKGNSGDTLISALWETLSKEINSAVWGLLT